MIIQLIDRNEKMCDEWAKLFNCYSDVVVHCGDFFSLETDCVVSPANSFGFMDGGLDKVISQKIGWGVQENLQNKIKNKPLGELLVGQAELIETDCESIPFCISAPTMRVPTILPEDTVNIYLATKAILILLREEQNRIKSVTISGLGTGIGGVSYETCAKQMKQAFVDVWEVGYKYPNTWYESQKRHQQLYTNEYRDLQFKK